MDQECIAANRDNTIEFEGGWKGDRVQFAKSCDDIAEPSEELFGQKKRAMWYQGEQLDGLKLCYKPDDSDAVPGYRASVKEQKDILLYIKKATLKNVISAFGPRIIPPNSETTMYFWGMWQNFEGQVHVGGKVCFAMEVTGCKACENGVRKAYDIETLDAVPGPIGKITYKSAAVKDTFHEILCYQAPDSCQWVRQTDTDLKVTNGYVPPSTSPTRISSIWPQVIVSNVMTSITFNGAEAGDEAIFINTLNNTNCEKVLPNKEVGFGEGMFTLSTLGVYLLCYRVAGARDSVLQTGFNVTVRRPGVTQEMIRPLETKSGTFDCSSLQLVPHCATVSDKDCETAYVIYKGAGVRCRWDQELWPPSCTGNSSKALAVDMCNPATCGGEPSFCW